MRKFLTISLTLFVILFAVLPLSAAGRKVEDIPNVQLRDSRRYTSNPDGILSAQAVERIDAVCASLRERGLAQVAVVAVAEIEGEDVFGFAIDLFRRWGVGGSRSNNGVGILLVKDRREIRFVTGGGVEGVLPDALCKRIQMTCMLPHFRRGDYDAGMVAGVAAAARLLEGADPDLEGQADGGGGWWMLLFVGGFFGLALWSIYRQKLCPKCHKMGLQYTSVREVIRTEDWVESEYVYICKHCGEVVVRRRRDQNNDHFGNRGGGGIFLGGMGGLGGGSMGGGFGGGGFGGGSFGGGGAGSKW